jgi:hypothetical protein
MSQQERVTIERATASAGQWNPVAGPTTVELGEHLVISRQLPSADAFLRVRSEAYRILSQCLPPGRDNARRTGLVVGYVQSGKTMSMSTVAALARDNGIWIVVAFAGTTKNLYDQSRKRFEGDLRGADSSPHRWLVLANPTADKYGRDLKVLADEWRNPRIDEEDQRGLFVTVMKQHQYLDKLASLLAKVDLSGITALIIDDEADQAGLNTRPLEELPSTTYRRIQQVRQRLPRHTYLQYTATPQAPLLISLVDMLSPDFAEVLEHGDGYTGGKTFFLEQPSLVRQIPKIDLEDVEAMPAPPCSLLEATRIFALGVAAAMVEQRSDYRSMLVHPSRLTVPHGTYKRWMDAILDRWRRVLELDQVDAERTELVREFTGAYADLAQTVTSMPPLEKLLAKLPIAIGRTVVTEVNSETAHEVDWNVGRSHVVVGGAKLDRGYTVRGLTVSYMPRGPGGWTADTIQQRARFFGYKRDYLGYCRVYIPQDIQIAYRAYVEHEEHIRQQMRDYRGLPLRDWRRAFYLNRRYRPTRDNVISDPYYRTTGTGWFRQGSPHFLRDAVTRNRAITNAFLGQLGFTSLLDRHKVARGVPLAKLVSELFAEYSFLGAHDRTTAYAIVCRLTEHLEQSPNAVCAVVLMDAAKERERSTKAGNDDVVENLHQGPDPGTSGRRYPGDAAVLDDSAVTVQVHFLRVRSHDSGEELGQMVPALAIHLPKELEKDWLIQPTAEGSDVDS